MKEQQLVLPNYSNGLVIHPVLEMIQASSSNVDTFSFFGRHEEMLSEKMDSNFHMAGASSNNGCATEAAAAARTKAQNTPLEPIFVFHP